MAQAVMFARSVRVRFWELIRQGLPAERAGALAGVSGPTASLWFRQAGGVNPDLKPSSYRLDLSQREEIRAMLERGCGVREIARALGRAPSTISREIRRGQHRSGGYKAVLAERRAQQRARRPKVGKLARSEALCELVQQRLNLKHSPEQIAARLRVDFPDQEEMQVSHETIYKALYVQGRGGLRKELTACLRTGRAVRKPRARAKAPQKRGQIPGMVSIVDRPAEVEDRAVPGHWEGDLITGARNQSAIGTLVERTTGFVILLHLPDGHTAAHVQQAMTKISQLPEILRRTLTWDRGTEMANHLQIAEALNLDIYFCDPHSPWQRGSNENTNGLLRQYFPKSTDLSGYTEDYLDYVADQLNNRPRKRHNWQTPAEELDRLLSMPDPTVAFTA